MKKIILIDSANYNDYKSYNGTPNKGIIAGIGRAIDFYNEIFKNMQNPNSDVYIPESMRYLPENSSYCCEIMPSIISVLNTLLKKYPEGSNTRKQIDKFFTEPVTRDFLKKAINQSLNKNVFMPKNVIRNLNTFDEILYKYLKKQKLLTPTILKRLKNRFDVTAKKDLTEEFSNLLENLEKEPNAFKNTMLIKKMLPILEDEKTFNRMLSRFSARKLIYVSMFLPFTDKVDAVKLYERIYKKNFSKKSSYTLPVKLNSQYTLFNFVTYLMNIGKTLTPMVRTPDDIFKVMEISLKVEPRMLMAMLGTFYVYGAHHTVVKIPEYLLTMKNYLLTRLSDEAVKYLVNKEPEEKLMEYLFSDNDDKNDKFLSRLATHIVPGIIGIKYFK